MTRLTLTSCLCLALAAPLFGCSGAGPDEDPTPGAAGSGGSGATGGSGLTGGSGGSAEVPTTWTDDVHPKVQLTCGTCHDAPGEAITIYDAPGWFGQPDPIAAYDEAIPYVVPGDAEASALYSRLVTTEPMMRMPPQVPAGDEVVEAVRRWIEDGALR